MHPLLERLTTIVAEIAVVAIRRPPATLVVRAAERADVAFLHEMVLDAAFPPRPRPPRAEALREPHVARMVDGWPRPGDAGVVGVYRGRKVGAAWYRRFTESELRSRWADPAVPELAIAVVLRHRERGWGRRLLEALVSQARQDGYDALDLQVGRGNVRALALYASCGFEPVGTPEGELVWMRHRLAL